MRGELLTVASRRAGLLSAAVALAALAPVLAHAHGSAPAAIEILATDDALAPSHLALSYGLAQRETSGAYAFVCPAAWGSTDAIFAARGDLVGVVSDGQLRVGTDACAIAAYALDTTMVDVVAGASGLLALGKREGKSRVFAVSAAATTLVAEVSGDGPEGCALDAIVAAADGGFVAACASPRPALFEPGDPSTVRPFVLPFGISRLVPRVVDATTVSLIATSAKGAYLVDLDRAVPAASPRVAGPFATVIGPARVGASTIAVVDGHLWRCVDGTWTQDRAVAYTCLSQVGASVFACSLGTTVRLEEQAGMIVEAAPVFSLAMIGEPTPACAEATGSAAVCRGEWAHFGAEAGLLDTEPATSPEGSRRAKQAAVGEPDGAPAEGGCGTAVDRRRARPSWACLTMAVASGLALRHKPRRLRRRGDAA